MNLHIGCGPILLPGFVNVDHEPSHNPNVCRDCVDFLASLEDCTADNIFTCHMLEHLEYPTKTVQFLEQCHRVLTAGGVLRIVVPDLMKVAEEYIYGDDDLKSIYGDGKFYYYKDCAAERFMYFAREWEHKVLFDGELLHELADDAGFSIVNRMPFGSSDVPCLRHIDRFENESISVECVK